MTPGLRFSRVEGTGVAGRAISQGEALSAATHAGGERAAVFVANLAAARRAGPFIIAPSADTRCDFEKSRV